MNLKVQWTTCMCDKGYVVLLQRPLSAGPGPQRAYSSMDGNQLGLFGSGNLGATSAAGGGGGGGLSGPAGVTSGASPLERPKSASSAAEEDLHRRLSTLGSGFGPGFF